MRADGFTEEQIRSWCLCHVTATEGVPNEACPLHGRYDVQWLCFSREVTLVEEPFEAIGLSFGEDDEDGDAFHLAETELESIKRYDRAFSPGRDMEYELRYRLLLDWQRPRA